MRRRDPSPRGRLEYLGFPSLQCQEALCVELAEIPRRQKALGVEAACRKGLAIVAAEHSRTADHDLAIRRKLYLGAAQRFAHRAKLGRGRRIGGDRDGVFAQRIALEHMEPDCLQALEQECDMGAEPLTMYAS